MMEPGYIVVLYSHGEDEPWVSNIRCKTKRAAEQIMELLAQADEDNLLRMWIVEDA